MITFQAVSRVLGAALIAVSIIVLFSAIAWLFWSDVPILIITLGVWIVSVALIWIKLWRATDDWRIDSRSDARRRAAVRALPLAISFAPTIVAPGPLIAFPLPASFALPLLVTNTLLAKEQIWNSFYQIILAATSLCIVWLVCFFVMSRTGSKRGIRHNQEASHAEQRARLRLKLSQTERSTYEY